MSQKHMKTPTWWFLPHTVTNLPFDSPRENPSACCYLRRLKSLSVRISLPVLSPSDKILLLPMWLRTEQFCSMRVAKVGSCYFCVLWNCNGHKKSYLPSASWAFLSSNGIHRSGVSNSVPGQRGVDSWSVPLSQTREWRWTQRNPSWPKLKFYTQELSY